MSLDFMMLPNFLLLPDIDALHRDLAAFNEFGGTTKIEHRRFGERDVPVYENEFWTAKQRGGHSLHEVSYRACYKPQLPRFFIQRFCRPGDGVYDPFMGRGTTLIEAQLLGCRVVGNDANPLSGVLAGPRLQPPTQGQVNERLGQVELVYEGEMDEDLLVFFSEKTLRELYAWRAYFRARKAVGTFDAVDAWIQMVACNRLTGHSPGFFSVYTLPPNQATSLEAQRRINAKRNQVPEDRDTKVRIQKKTKQLLRDPLPSFYGRHGSLIVCASADQTAEVPTDSVRLVVTSPPFLDVVDYVGDNWLRSWFCELEIDRKTIWQLGSLSHWVARMTEVLKELKRVLQPGGVVAFEVGEVRSGAVLLENEVVNAGIAAGLVPECILIHSQDFTKTANCWGVDNNRKGTNSNRIVVMTK